MKQDQNLTFLSSRKARQGGQAVVEYVLLLVIIVGLAIGAKAAFGKLNNFLNRYIGDYMVCLMEYGELPTLGVSESDLKKHEGGGGKSCDQEFGSFTFADGRPPTGGGSGSRTGGTSKSTGSKNSSSSASSKGASEKSKDSGKSDSAGKSAGRRNGGGGDKDSSGGSSPYTTGKIQRSSAYVGTSDGDSAGRTRAIEEEEEDTGRGKKRLNRRFTMSGGRSEKYRAITGAMVEEFEKTEKKRVKRAPTASIIKLPDSGGNRFKPYKKSFTPPEIKKTELKESEVGGFAFANIIRWLLIGGMIIAIIVFFGGQVMNYNNSKD